MNTQRRRKAPLNRPDDTAFEIQEKEIDFMSTLSNLLLCRSFARRVINERDLALAPAFIAPNSVHHEIGDGPEDAQGGPGAMTRFLGAYLRAFPDLRIVFEDALAGSDRVATRWRFEGTHAGPLAGIPASGRRVSVEGIRIDRIADGKIAESWMQWDLLGLFEQIGAAAAPRPQTLRLVRGASSLTPP